MNIVVLNGSPKGKDLSITMRSVELMSMVSPGHRFTVIDIASDIRKIEEDKTVLEGIAEAVDRSDGVLWAFPVYILLIPSQYKRFIELIFERGIAGAFKDKYAATVSTSVHFYDTTAHDYMRAICDDLDMKYIDSFSGERCGLLSDKERRQLISFTSYFLEAIEKKAFTAKRFRPVTGTPISYTPGRSGSTVSLRQKRMVIIVDDLREATNLAAMVRKLRAVTDGDVSLVDLARIPLKGGCLGCFKCGFDSRCVYDDGFDAFYTTTIASADILIFAGEIRDRYLSSRWKMFIDRSFFNNHIPVLRGKQVGIMISGPLNENHHLRQILEAYCDWQQAHLVDIISDEQEDSGAIDHMVEGLAERLSRHVAHDYSKSQTFYGIAGTRLLRDYVWGQFRFVLQNDYRMYKKLGLFNFPQRDIKVRVINSVMVPLMRIPAFRGAFMRNIRQEIIKPHRKALARYEQKKI